LEDGRKIAYQFARYLKDELKTKYGLEDEDAIIKSWYGNGYQLGEKLIQGKRKYKDAVADRPNIFLEDDDNYDTQSIN
jgi:hypothetical protein